MSAGDILDRLKPRFLARAAELLEMLRQRAAGRGAADPDLRLAIHKLIGTAAMFGFHELGAAGTAAETGWLETGLFDAADLDALAAELEALPRPEG